jgi:hypothetical protein
MLVAVGNNRCKGEENRQCAFIQQMYRTRESRGITRATVKLIETDLTEALPKVLWAANPREPEPGMGQIRTMRFCIGCIACVLMLLAHAGPGLTETDHNFVTRVYVGNPGPTDENTQDVHIVYSNGADVVAPKEKDQPASTDPAVADDKHTVGWLAEYWVGGQSYSPANTSFPALAGRRP